MKEKDLKFKIGYCQNKYLKGVYGDKESGHYVIIKNINENGSCIVNTITSLETDDKKLKLKKIKELKKGVTYAIPYKDANFKKWSAVNTISVKCSNIKHIKSIGSRYINKRHNYYIDKFCNKKGRR